MALEGNFIKLQNRTPFAFVFSKLPNAVLFWLMALRIWKAAGVCTHVLDGHSGPVTSVCNLTPRGTKGSFLLKMELSL